MASMKLGSKPDSFQLQGRFWFCMTGLPSDVVVEVEDISFHLHKFPLLSKSLVLSNLIEETAGRDKGDCVISLPDIPGGAKAFQLVAKFCYGVKFELTATNVVSLRCAAEHLRMTEDISESNLIAQTESFLNQAVLRSWTDTLKALLSCDELLLPHAQSLEIVQRCVESLATKACVDPNPFGWPAASDYIAPMQSPGGSFLWNGINTGAKPKSCSSDWWYEDVSSLSLQIYKKLISVMEIRGASTEILAGSLAFYAVRYLPGLNRHHSIVKDGTFLTFTMASAALPEDVQLEILEEIENLLPFQKGVVTTGFLMVLLRTATILGASASCLSKLEKRVGIQLDEASLKDLLLPNFSDSDSAATEMLLYDVDCVRRILDHFLATASDRCLDGSDGGESPLSIYDDEKLMMELPPLTPLTMVARLIDGYLAEVAPDVNLKLAKFQSLVAAVPVYARTLHDGLYRAIDIYLKAHPWLTEPEREQLCRQMDCQKLSLEACTHAAQNDRLPLRTVVQVLFFEQLQLRTSIAGCLLVSDNLDVSRPLTPSYGGGGSGDIVPLAASKDLHPYSLKSGMDNMRMRVSELEKECLEMKDKIEKLVGGRDGAGAVVARSQGNSLSRNFQFKFRSRICKTEENSVTETRSSAEITSLRALQVKQKNLQF